MASTSKCSIGVYLNEECHKNTYNSQIELRRGTDQPLTDICNQHEKYFLVKYVTFQYECCDPLLAHKKPWKGEEIVLLSVANFSLFLTFISGNKQIVNITNTDGKLILYKIP